MTFVRNKVAFHDKKTLFLFILTMKACKVYMIGNLEVKYNKIDYSKCKVSRHLVDEIKIYFCSFSLCLNETKKV